MYVHTYSTYVFSLNYVHIPHAYPYPLAHVRTCIHKFYIVIRRHNSDVYLRRTVPGSKWRLLSNVLARVGKTGETAANWNNSRPWIGLFQGAKCDNVPKRDLELALGKSVVVAVTPFSLFHIILFLLILPTEFLRTSSA